MQSTVLSPDDIKRHIQAILPKALGFVSRRYGLDEPDANLAAKLVTTIGMTLLDQTEHEILTDLCRPMKVRLAILQAALDGVPLDIYAIRWGFVKPSLIGAGGAA